MSVGTYGLPLQPDSSLIWHLPLRVSFLRQISSRGNCNGRISNLGNDASANMQVKMAEGAWIQLRKVDFGETGAEKFTVRAKGAC